MQQHTISFFGFCLIFSSLSLFSAPTEARSCSPAFLIESQAAVGKRELAKKAARQKVQRQAKQRCRDKKLVYVQRWQYLCENKDKRFACKARMKFRCCSSSVGQTKKDTSKRVLVKGTKPVKEGTNKPRSKTKKKMIAKGGPSSKARKTSRKKARKTSGYRMAVARSTGTEPIRRSKGKSKVGVMVKGKSQSGTLAKGTLTKRNKKTSRKVARLEPGKGQVCRAARIEVQGYHRSPEQKKAEIEARGHARIRANERCGSLLPVWVSGWTYKCARSGKNYICRAKSAIKCCQKKP